MDSLTGTVARNIIEPNSPWDFPDEGDGVVVVLGAGFLLEGNPYPWRFTSKEPV